MPVLDEAFLARYGQLTVEQFLRKQFEAQLEQLKRDCRSMSEALSEQAKLSDNRIKNKFQRA